MSRNRKKKRGLSNGFKWIVTFLLVIIAVSMVIICVNNGVFHFEAGSVTANDDDAAMATDAPENNEQAEETDSSSKFTVFVTAGNGGTANPAGSVSVEAWDSITVSFTADDGYEVESVTLDGQELGAVSSYTISYIDANHTVVATFAEEEPEESEDPENEGESGGSGGSGGTSIDEVIANGITDIFEKIIGG